MVVLKFVKLRSFVIVAFILASTHSAVCAKQMRCPTTSITVSGGTAADLPKICAAAMWTVAFFRQCNFETDHDIRIEIVDRVVHPFGPAIIAKFDADLWKIQITEFSRLPQLILPHSAYQTLPLQEVYESVLVHEVAHALFRNGTSDLKLPVSAHEYVAYAVQLASLPPISREKFLSLFVKRSSRNLSRFNEVYLGMAPLAFAANAFWHLYQSENHCAMLHAIASGKASFPLPLE